jgi:phospholipase/carboxylesterase
LSKITNGSSLQPASGGSPKQIVVLLHGYGSNGQDLISLAGHWQNLLPDALFLAPNAPQRFGFGGGYQWWPLSALSPQALASGAASAAPAIDAFIDRKLEQYGLTDAELALVGFSQGTMMALHVGVRRERQVAGIVGYSGALTGGADLTSQAKTKPPVLLIHGSADQVVPVAALHAAERELKQFGVKVRTHISPGLGHSVDPTGLRMGAEFLVESLSAKA